MKETEKLIENAVLAYLTLQVDILAFKVNTVGVYDTGKKCFRRPSKYVMQGTADIIACLNVQGIGVFLALEVKSATGVQSEHQKLFAYRLKEKNGFYFLVRSIPDAEKAIAYARKVTLQNMQKGILSKA